MLRRLLFALAAACVMAPAAAAQEHVREPEPYHFSFEGPFGTYDRAAVQRGFLVYKQVCSNCHSLNQLSYRNLGEEGGPFEAFREHNLQTGEETITLSPHGEAEAIEANDNPYVREFASEVMIPIIDDLGQPAERPGRPSDHFKAPFANEQAARAANGGALPPDLSVMPLAREGGAAYIRSLVGFGFTGELRDGKHVNRYFPGELIGMAPPLSDGMVTYSDGTEASVAQMATDVAQFLQWAADPHMEARKRAGFQVLFYLGILTLLLYLGYRQVWRGTKH